MNVRKTDSVKRKAKTKLALIQRLFAGEDDGLRLKVAHTLSYFPAARDSDITLAIKLLKTFYPNFVLADNMVRLDDLYEIPKFYDMQRHRAALQNSFGLFRASPEVEKFRKKHQYKEAEASAKKKPDSEPVLVFADESGKTDKHLIIGSLWLYKVDDHRKATNGLKEWRKSKNFDKEFHFKELKSDVQLQAAIEFFEQLIASTSMHAFKALVVRNEGIHANRRIDALYQGFGELLIDGIKSEILTNRLSPPVGLHLTKHADPSTDVFKLREVNRRLLEAFSIEFKDGQVTFDVNGVNTLRSQASDLVQISDLFTGSLNRWLNHTIADPPANAKDKFADYLRSHFGWRLDNLGKIQTCGDVCQIIQPDGE